MRTTTAYIPVAQVIGDAAQELGDGEFRKYGRPAYVSAAQRALATLCHTVPWDVRHFQAPIPEDRILKLPWGTNEKSLVVLFNGPRCDFNNVRTLFIKPGLFHNGGSGYVANNTGGGVDVVPRVSWNTSWPDNWLFFAGETNGNLYLSPSCSSYENIHITYMGLGMECWGDDFCIPEWAREAITDMVILRAAKTLRSLTNGSSTSNMYREIINEKEQATAITNPNGTWLQALSYWGRMDEKQRNDVWSATTYFGEAPY